MLATTVDKALLKIIVDLSLEGDGSFVPLDEFVDILDILQQRSALHICFDGHFIRPAIEPHLEELSRWRLIEFDEHKRAVRATQVGALTGYNGLSFPEWTKLNTELTS